MRSLTSAAKADVMLFILGRRLTAAGSRGFLLKKTAQFHCESQMPPRRAFARPLATDLLPTACVCLGLAPFETLKLSTPESHAQFELSALPPADESEKTKDALAAEGGIMPWEQTEEESKKMLEETAKLPLAEDEALAETFKKLSEEREDEKEPEKLQRGPEWYKKRRFKLSASQVASVVRKSPFMSRRKLLYSKVYPKAHAYAGNTYTNWGTVHEPHAEEAFEQRFLTPRAGAYLLKHFGFVNGKGRLWFGGFSPDGVLHRRQGEGDAAVTSHELVEYKCSAHHRDSDAHPYKKYWKCIPEHYLIQLQYSMHIARQRPQFQGMERAWFVCWQPHAVHVTHVPYMPEYAASLVEHASDFYHKRFVPACLKALKKPMTQTSLEDFVDPDEHLKRKRGE